MEQNNDQELNLRNVWRDYFGNSAKKTKKSENWWEKKLKDIQKLHYKGLGALGMKSKKNGILLWAQKN